MDLDEHCSRFKAEHVSGEVLLQCDDTALRDDLGVASRVHRIRLLQIITGTHSVPTLFQEA